MTDNEKVIKKLQEKIAEYEQLLETLLSKPKGFGKVIAGPVKDDKKIYYRVETGAGEVLASYEESMIFKGEGNKIEIGTEVVVLDGAVIAIVPQGLFTAKAKNGFKLISWEEIGGLKSQLQSIKETVEMPLKNTKLFREMGLNPCKGILLWGPPGCGKTLIGKAIASVILNDSKADDESFIYIKGPELLNMYVGASEAAIRLLFKRSRLYSIKTGKRAVMFIDEAESLLPARGSRVSSDVETTIVPMFLSEMDGFDDNSPMVILSTNLPEHLDRAIIRDGRVDLKVKVDYPTREDGEDIFNIHFKKVKCADTVADLACEANERLFSMKEKVSGAMIENIVKTITRRALVRKVNEPKSKTGVTMKDLKEVLAYEPETEEV